MVFSDLFDDSFGMFLQYNITICTNSLSLFMSCFNKKKTVHGKTQTDRAVFVSLMRFCLSDDLPSEITTTCNTTHLVLTGACIVAQYHLLIDKYFYPQYVH